MSVLALDPCFEFDFESDFGFDFGFGDRDLTATSPAAPRHLHVVPPVQTMDDDDDDFAFGPQPTPTCVLPPLAPWAHRLTQLIVEVIEGRRSQTQAIKHVAPSVLPQVASTVAPSRTRTAASAFGVVSRVRVCDVADGIAEVAATVRRGAELFVVALRFEGLDGRWICTALEM